MRLPNACENVHKSILLQWLTTVQITTAVQKKGKNPQNSTQTLTSRSYFKMVLNFGTAKFRKIGKSSGEAVFGKS